MKQTGYVIKEKENIVTVQVPRVTACGEKCTACGAGCKPQMISVDVENQLQASVGEVVEIESESKKILKFAFAVYILPVLFLILGMLGVGFILEAMGKELHELLMLSGGFVCFLLGMLIIKLMDRKQNRDHNEIFRMIRIM